jgi:hypothetical protein
MPGTGGPSFPIGIATRLYTVMRMSHENRPMFATAEEIESAVLRIEALERKLSDHIAQLEPLLNLLKPFRLIVMMSIFVMFIVGGIWHIESRFDARFAAMDAKFAAMDAKFDAMNKRIDGVIDRMDVMNRNLTTIIINHAERITALETKRH